MWMYGTAWWMWLLMGAGMIGFWVVVVLTVKALLEDRRPETPATPDPTQVLEVRLARGELDADQYLRLRSLIQQGHPTDLDRRPAHPLAP
jgi:putative membrane protein